MAQLYCIWTLWGNWQDDPFQESSGPDLTSMMASNQPGPWAPALPQSITNVQDGWPSSVPSLGLTESEGLHTVRNSCDAARRRQASGHPSCWRTGPGPPLSFRLEPYGHFPMLCFLSCLLIYSTLILAVLAREGVCSIEISKCVCSHHVGEWETDAR